MSNVVKFTVSLQGGLHSGLATWARAEGMTLNDLIRDQLTQAAENAGFLPQTEIEMMKLYRELSVQVADAAEEIVSEMGICPPDITAKAIHRCQNDPAWLAGYATCVQGDPFAPSNEYKRNLNPNLGYRVKKRLGASNCLNANGKDQIVKVKDLVIQSYTALEIR